LDDAINEAGGKMQAWHGGQLNGVSSRAVMENAKKFFEIVIREPEIAECSKNARICNILLENFHIYLFFTKKLLFHIRVRC
jgi:hypothetical protein